MEEGQSRRALPSVLRRRVSADEAGQSLVDSLRAWLLEALPADVSRTRVRAMIVAGAVRVDGTVLRRPGRRLDAGQRVEARLWREALVPRRTLTDRVFELTEAAIVYRDEHVLAVSKPAGLPTHATADPDRAHLVRHVQDWLSRQGRRPYLAVHQRLDRDTSGVVLFATDPAANAALARSFERDEVDKAYLALTRRPAVPPPPQFRISTRLGTTRGRVHVVTSGGQLAETSVRVRAVLERALLLEVHPKSGRKHQIRVHLAHAGLPILGDAIYGQAAPEVPRMMLHALRLALLHPLTGAALVLESPLPADFRRVLDSCGG